MLLPALCEKSRPVDTIMAASPAPYESIENEDPPQSIFLDSLSLDLYSTLDARQEQILGDINMRIEQLSKRSPSKTGVVPPVEELHSKSTEFRSILKGSSFSQERSGGENKVAGSGGNARNDESHLSTASLAKGLLAFPDLDDMSSPVKSEKFQSDRKSAAFVSEDRETKVVEAPSAIQDPVDLIELELQRQLERDLQQMSFDLDRERKEDGDSLFLDQMLSPPRPLAQNTTRPTEEESFIAATTRATGTGLRDGQFEDVGFIRGAAQNEPPSTMAVQQSEQQPQPNAEPIPPRPIQVDETGNSESGSPNRLNNDASRQFTIPTSFALNSDLSQFSDEGKSFPLFFRPNEESIPEVNVARNGDQGVPARDAAQPTLSTSAEFSAKNIPPHQDERVEDCLEKRFNALLAAELERTESILNERSRQDMGSKSMQRSTEKFEIPVSSAVVQQRSERAESNVPFNAQNAGNLEQNLKTAQDSTVNHPATSPDQRGYQETDGPWKSFVDFTTMSSANRFDSRSEGLTASEGISGIGPPFVETEKAEGRGSALQTDPSQQQQQQTEARPVYSNSRNVADSLSLPPPTHSSFSSHTTYTMHQGGVPDIRFSFTTDRSKISHSMTDASFQMSSPNRPSFMLPHPSEICMFDTSLDSPVKNMKRENVPESPARRAPGASAGGPKESLPPQHNINADSPQYHADPGLMIPESFQGLPRPPSSVAATRGAGSIMTLNDDEAETGTHILTDVLTSSSVPSTARASHASSSGPSLNARQPQQNEVRGMGLPNSGSAAVATGFAPLLPVFDPPQGTSVQQSLPEHFQRPPRPASSPAFDKNKPSQIPTSTNASRPVPARGDDFDRRPIQPQSEPFHIVDTPTSLSSFDFGHRTLPPQYNQSQSISSSPPRTQIDAPNPAALTTKTPTPEDDAAMGRSRNSNGNSSMNVSDPSGLSKISATEQYVRQQQLLRDDSVSASRDRVDFGRSQGERDRSPQHSNSMTNAFSRGYSRDGVRDEMGGLSDQYRPGNSRDGGAEKRDLFARSAGRLDSPPIVTGFGDMLKLDEQRSPGGVGIDAGGAGSGQGAVISALRTLQDKVGRLESEKQAAKQRILDLERELSKARQTIYHELSERERERRMKKMAKLKKMREAELMNLQQRQRGKEGSHGGGKGENHGEEDSVGVDDESRMRRQRKERMRPVEMDSDYSDSSPRPASSASVLGGMSSSSSYLSLPAERDKIANVGKQSTSSNGENVVGKPEFDGDKALEEISRARREIDELKRHVMALTAEDDDDDDQHDENALSGSKQDVPIKTASSLGSNEDITRANNFVRRSPKKDAHPPRDSRSSLTASIRDSSSSKTSGGTIPSNAATIGTAISDTIHQQRQEARMPNTSSSRASNEEDEDSVDGRGVQKDNFFDAEEVERLKGEIEAARLSRREKQGRKKSEGREAFEKDSGVRKATKLRDVPPVWAEPPQDEQPPTAEAGVVTDSFQDEEEHRSQSDSSVHGKISKPTMTDVPVQTESVGVSVAPDGVHENAGVGSKKPTAPVITVINPIWKKVGSIDRNLRKAQAAHKKKLQPLLAFKPATNIRDTTTRPTGMKSGSSTESLNKLSQKSESLYSQPKSKSGRVPSVGSVASDVSGSTRTKSGSAQPGRPNSTNKKPTRSAPAVPRSQQENVVPSSQRQVGVGATRVPQDVNEQHDVVPKENMQEIVGVAREMPFVVGTSTGKSYSVTANIQKVFSLLKAHNPALCSVCSKRKHASSQHTIKNQQHQQATRGRSTNGKSTTSTKTHKHARVTVGAAAGSVRVKSNTNQQQKHQRHGSGKRPVSLSGPSSHLHCHTTSDSASRKTRSDSHNRRYVSRLAFSDGRIIDDEDDSDSPSSMSDDDDGGAKSEPTFAQTGSGRSTHAHGLGSRLGQGEEEDQAYQHQSIVDAAMEASMVMGEEG
ncbi:hypothetical protein HK102_012669, partial [Quaeritorhiza haematococci]